MNVRKFVEHFCHDTLLHVRMAVQESFTSMTSVLFMLVVGGGGGGGGEGRRMTECSPIPGIRCVCVCLSVCVCVCVCVCACVRDGIYWPACMCSCELVCMHI